jgi:hypothetical protein
MDVQVVCGCFKGDLGDFENAIQTTHKNTVHLAPYLKLIELAHYMIDFQF